MASRAIENNSLKCFYSEYSKLGGNTLPKDIVNMVIQQVEIPQEVLYQNSIKMALYMNVSKQIVDMKVKRKKDIWILTNIFTQQEYGFVVSYQKWLLKKFF